MKDLLLFSSTNIGKNVHKYFSSTYVIIYMTPKIEVTEKFLGVGPYITGMPSNRHYQTFR